MIRRHAINWFLLALVAVSLAAPGRASAARPSPNPAAVTYHAATLTSAPRMCARGNACARPNPARPAAEVGIPVASAAPLAARRGVVGATRNDGGRRLSAPVAVASQLSSGRDGAQRAPLVSDRVRQTVLAAFFHEAHAPPASSLRSAGRPV